MSPAAFLLLVRQRITQPAPSKDPLDDARRLIDQCGDSLHGQMLRKIVTALATDETQFSE